MNHRDDRACLCVNARRQAGPLFATNDCDKERSHAYGRLSKYLLRAKEQAGVPACACRTQTGGSIYE